jgi:hypothetical protein
MILGIVGLVALIVALILVPVFLGGSDSYWRER